MWWALPAHVIIKIFNYIDDTKSKIAAATACRNWRYTVIDSREIVLKKNHVTKFTCSEQDANSNEDDVELMIKCIPHVETLVFRWCKCKTNDFLDVLSKIVEKPLPVRRIMLQGGISCSKACLRTLQGGDVIRKTERVICSLLKCCNRLDALDLGFEPYLPQSEQVMRVINSKLLSGKLIDLNIAAIRIVDMTAEVLHMDKFIMLDTVCLSWDSNLLQMIKVLSEDSNSQARLKQLTVTVSSLNFLENHLLSEEQLSNVAEFHPELKMKLVLINGLIPESRQFQDCKTAYKQIHIILGYERVSFTLITNVREPGQFLFSLLYLGANDTRHTLDELSLHYVEIERKMRWCELSCLKGPAHLMFSGIERLELCGMLIDDYTVIDITESVTNLESPSVFKDFIVYRMDVLCRSDSTGLHTPITDALANELEGIVSETLGRDWKLATDGHSNREQDCGDIQSKFRSVIRDVCKVVK